MHITILQILLLQSFITNSNIDPEHAELQLLQLINQSAAEYQCGAELLRSYEEINVCWLEIVEMKIACNDHY